MNNEEKNWKTTESQDGSLDEQIYRAMVELGWVFPQTVEEVEIAEEQMDRETAPPHTGLPTAEDILKRMGSANSRTLVVERMQLLPLLRQRSKMKATAMAKMIDELGAGDLMLVKDAVCMHGNCDCTWESRGPNLSARWTE